MDERHAVRMFQADLFEEPRQSWRSREFREAVQPALAALIARLMTAHGEAGDDQEE